MTPTFRTDDTHSGLCQCGLCRPNTTPAPDNVPGPLYHARPGRTYAPRTQDFTAITSAEDTTE